jgi:hypothetical protein
MLLLSTVWLINSMSIRRPQQSIYTKCGIVAILERP